MNIFCLKLMAKFKIGETFKIIQQTANEVLVSKSFIGVVVRSLKPIQIFLSYAETTNR